MKDELIVVPILENLSVIADFLQERIKQAHLASRKAWELLLATDEICSHIIQFRKYDTSMGKMKIVWEGYPDRVIITIEVSGIPFNPLDPTSKDNTKDDEEEVLGGMCLHLVQQMIDEFSYSRTNNNNVFRVTKFRKSRRNKVEK